MCKQRPTTKALKDCANWLCTCLELGWSKDSLDTLEAIWWRFHDRNGYLIKRGSDDPR